MSSIPSCGGRGIGIVLVSVLLSPAQESQVLARAAHLIGAFMIAGEDLYSTSSAVTLSVKKEQLSSSAFHGGRTPGILSDDLSAQAPACGTLGACASLAAMAAVTPAPGRRLLLLSCGTPIRFLPMRFSLCFSEITHCTIKNRDRIA